MSSSVEFDDIKKEVRSTLLGFPHGCSFADFMKDYKNFVRPKFLHEQLGFSNEMECLRAMPDAVKISRSGNDYHLVGIPDENTKHIKKMVSKQKNAKRKPKPVSHHSKGFYGSGSMSNPRQKMAHTLPSQEPNPYQRTTPVVPTQMSNHWQQTAHAIPPQMWHQGHRITPLIPPQVLANAMQMQTQKEFRNQNIPRASPLMPMNFQRAYTSGSQANVGGEKALPPIVVQEIVNLVRRFATGLSFRDFFASYFGHYKKFFSYQQYGFYTLEDCIISIPQLEIVAVNYDLRIRFVSEGDKRCTKDSKMQLENKSIPTDKPKSSEDVPQRRKADELFKNFQKSGLSFVVDTKKSSPEQQSNPVNIQTEFHKREPSVKESKSTTDLRGTGTLSDAKKKIITSSFKIPEIPEDVKHNLRKVMAKCQNGIWAKEFPSIYKVVTHEDLHLYAMGYQDLASFVEAVPDIMIPKTVITCSTDWLIYPPQPTKELAMGPNETTARLVDSIILRIRKILQAYTEGVPLQDFLEIYCLNCGDPLYITNLGFDSLENFLHCIADRVPFEFQTDGSGKSLHFVLPEEMVKPSVTLNQHTERAPPCSPSKEYHRMPKAPQGCPFPVHVLSVVDPGHLFIGLKGEDTSDAMLRMNAAMQAFYNECTDNRYVMGDLAIRNGVPAVARCSHDSHWYRVKVQSVSSVPVSSVQVFCVDYGFLKVVKKTSLRYISEDFLSLPPQALKARLANLRPPNDESKWNPKTKEIIESMCLDIPLLAQVLNISDGVHSVVLCDAIGQNSVGEKLMREGLAVFEPSAIPQGVGFPGVSDPQQLLQMFLQACFSTMANMTPAAAASNFLPNPPAASGTSSGASQETPEEFLESVDVEDSDSSDSEDDSSVLFDDDADSVFEDFCQKVSIVTKRYVKRITSADGYRFHILIFESKPYVSSGDISTLIWSDKDSGYLQQRPQLKEYLGETITLSDNEEMFEQFTRFHVKGRESNNGKSCVLVYPLESVIQILNTFGHPSADLRTKILNERDSFNPLHPKWKELSEVEIPDSDEEGCFGGTDDAKLNRLCLFDLQVMKEGIRIKSSKLKSGDAKDEEERVKLQQLSERVVDRMDEIRHICSNFSSA